MVFFFIAAALLSVHNFYENNFLEGQGHGADGAVKRLGGLSSQIQGELAGSVGAVEGSRALAVCPRIIDVQIGNVHVRIADLLLERKGGGHADLVVGIGVVGFHLNGIDGIS